MIIIHYTFIDKNNNTGFSTLESERDLKETLQHLTNKCLRKEYKVIEIKNIIF